jgi:hypothetical protein
MPEAIIITQIFMLTKNNNTTIVDCGLFSKNLKTSNSTCRLKSLIEVGYLSCLTNQSTGPTSVSIYS